jgi:hypothetical protein
MCRGERLLMAAIYWHIAGISIDDHLPPRGCIRTLILPSNSGKGGSVVTVDTSTNGAGRTVTTRDTQNNLDFKGERGP